MAASRKRGWGFSVDAMFAAFILAMMLGGVSFLSAGDFSGMHSRELHSKSAGILGTISKNGDLASLDQTRINGTISSLHGASGWLLEAEAYNYSAGNFTQISNFTLGAPPPEGAHSSSATRLLPSINPNTSRSEFISARLVLWQE